MGGMDQNPYQSPEPPEEPVAFRAIGDTWSGWKKIGDVGVVLFSLSILAAIVFGVSGLKPNWYVSLVFLLNFGGGIALVLVGRFGAYLHSIVLMFRDEYN